MRIFLSSTFNDLRAASEALAKLHHDVSDFSTDEAPIVAERLENVRRSDFYVGVFAWQYGYVPPDPRYGGLSISELEYREAQKQGIPTLIFLLREDAPANADPVDERLHRIKALREELQKEQTVTYFRDPADLSAELTTRIKSLGPVGNSRKPRARANVVTRHAGDVRPRARLESPTPDFFQQDDRAALRSQAQWLATETGVGNASLASFLRVEESTLQEWRDERAELRAEHEDELRGLWHTFLHLLSFVNFDVGRLKQLLHHRVPQGAASSPLTPSWAGSSLLTYLEQRGAAALDDVDDWVSSFRFGDPYDRRVG